MSYVVEYKGYYDVPELEEDVINEWKETLKGQRDRILNNLLARIPNETKFRSLIADSAYEVWQNFVNPSWEDADIIKMKFQVKLSRAYDVWKDRVTEAFTPGDTGISDFEKGVDGAVNKFANAKYTVGAVGLRYARGRGIAVKAIGVISGDLKVVRDIAAPDEFTGSVVNVFLPGAARYVRPQAIAIITRGLVLAQYALEAGLSALRDSIISSTNSILGNTVLKQVDTATYPTVILEIGYDDVNNKLYVHSAAATS